MIAATHARAGSWAETDWREIVRLYDLLLALHPSPVVTLNRAIALGERDGPAAALDELGPLATPLDRYHLFHATRGELLTRLGRKDEASEALRRALALVENRAERALLEERLETLG